MKSYDVKLAGDPYVFDSKGIQLGGASKENIQQGQLGTIIIPSVHAGIGNSRDRTVGRHWYSTGAITHKPSLLLPDFDRTAALATLARGTPLYPWTLAYERGGLEDKAFLIGPKKLYSFDPYIDVPVLTEVVNSDLSALSGGDKQYTGSCFLWNSQWIFGFETMDKVAAGFARVGPGSSSGVYDNVSSAYGTSYTLTWAHTIGGGANRLLMVGVSTMTAVSVSGVKFNGVSMTPLDYYQDAGNNIYISVWYMKESSLPTAGTYNIVATASSSPNTIAGGATSWSGIHQGTTFGTVAKARGNSNTPSVTVEAVTSDVVHDFVGADGGVLFTLTSDLGQFTRWNAGSPSSPHRVAGSTKTGETSTIMSWTSNQGVYWATIGVAIKPNVVGTTNTAILENTPTKAVSFGAAQRGRVFWTRNNGNGIMTVYWAPQVIPAVNFEDVSFTKYGPIYTDTIRSTWVSLWGGTLFVARDDGSLLGTDETGFMGIAMPSPVRRSASISSPTLSVSFGRNANPYLDMLLLPAVDTVWGFNPNNLSIRALDPAAVQGTDDPFMQSIYLATASAGTHAFIGGLTTASTGGVGRIYRLNYENGNVGAHAFSTDFAINERVISLLTCMRFDSDRDPTLYLYSLTDDGTNVKLYRNTLRTDSNPTSVHPTGVVSNPTYLAFPTYSGDQNQQNISKLFLQMRGRVSLPTGGTPKLSSTAYVDGNAVTIADVTADGEFAQSISATSLATLIGRSFSLGLNLYGTNPSKSLYFPLSVDFLWVPSQHDLITLHVLVGGNTVTNVGGLWNRDSAKTQVDKLMALENTITTAEFPGGTVGASAITGTVSWNLFVQNVDVAQKTGEIDSSGAPMYEVVLTCRKL